MDGTAWAGVFTLIGTLIGLGFTAYKFRNTQRSADTNANHDQLQEDLTSLAERFDKYVARSEAREQRDDRKMRNRDQVIRHLDDEINELRRIMVEAGLTPPPRKPFPPYPGERGIFDAG